MLSLSHGAPELTAAADIACTVPCALEELLLSLLVGSHGQPHAKTRHRICFASEALPLCSWAAQFDDLVGSCCMCSV